MWAAVLNADSLGDAQKFPPRLQNEREHGVAMGWINIVPQPAATQGKVGPFRPAECQILDVLARVPNLYYSINSECSGKIRGRRGSSAPLLLEVE
jgi:hypothetical protein